MVTFHIPKKIKLQCEIMARVIRQTGEKNIKKNQMKKTNGQINKAFNNMKQPRVLINNSLHVKYLHKVTSFLYNLLFKCSHSGTYRVVSGKKSL